ncbi:sporulation integral membrane protein YtvI [Bacillus dakarensis]|uniref:sporulation integral membrane protein YtvI n=1 Tax=Robertmurraya dakarensis TaxID=1926278 RepID=UPI000981E1FA|nr:sporulation integral membrane protein YtvI [Bacillus dakarensis]
MSGLFSKRFFITAIVVVLAVILLYFILPVSIPLILAFITALFLHPLVKFLQGKSKINRHLSVLIVFLIFLFFIGISGYFITTKVVTEAIKIVENSPYYINEITRAWLKAEKDFATALKDVPQEVVVEISQQVQTFLNTTKNELIAYVNIDNVKALLTNIPNYLVSFVVYLIALFLFLLELPRLREGFYNLLTDKTAQKVNFMSSKLGYVVFGFFKAQFLVSVIIFFVSLIGLYFIAPDLALVMSLIIWIIDFIPIIGSIVILGPWALFHLITGNIALGTQLAVLAAILLVIRRTVEPKVMGSHIGLSPLATLIAMYLGLKLLGILGFIIGPLLLIAFNTAKEANIIKFNFKI